MNFARDGRYDQVSRITGPHHNLLGLDLSPSPGAGAPAIEILPATGGCHHDPLDADKILRAVVDGVASANLRLGTTFSVRAIRWVANDTPPEDVYGYLASCLVEHLAQDPYRVAEKLPAWRSLSPKEASAFEVELARELSKEHVLRGRTVHALAQGPDHPDDILFSVDGAPFAFAAVHLTWSAEKRPQFPRARLFGTLEELAAADTDLRDSSS